MKENCGNCRNRFELRKSDYSKGGCEHSQLDGFVCMAFAIEGIAEWMVGLDEEKDMCECYMPKRQRRASDERK